MKKLIVLIIVVAVSGLLVAMHEHIGMLPEDFERLQKQEGLINVARDTFHASVQSLRDKFDWSEQSTRKALRNAAAPIAKARRVNYPQETAQERYNTSLKQAVAQLIAHENEERRIEKEREDK